MKEVNTTLWVEPDHEIQEVVAAFFPAGKSTNKMCLLFDFTSTCRVSNQSV